MELLQVMKVLTDRTSLRILNLLRDGELCICEIDHLLGINHTNVSRHLHRLTVSKLISCERRAYGEHYKINADVFLRYPFIECLLNEELTRIEKFRSDSEKLKRFKKRGLSCEFLQQMKPDSEVGKTESGSLET